MLYSSCKEPLIAGVEQDLGIKIAKKVYARNLLDLVMPSKFESSFSRLKLILVMN